MLRLWQTDKAGERVLGQEAACGGIVPSRPQVEQAHVAVSVLAGVLERAWVLALGCQHLL